MTYLTPPEIAKLLRVTPEKVLDFIHRGELEAFNLASPESTRARWRISDEALEAFLRRRAAAPPPKPAKRKKKEDYPVYV